jgi:hypothetical protein
MRPRARPGALTGIVARCSIQQMIGADRRKLLRRQDRIESHAKQIVRALAMAQLFQFIGIGACQVHRKALHGRKRYDDEVPHCEVCSLNLRSI